MKRTITTKRGRIGTFFQNQSWKQISLYQNSLPLPCLSKLNPCSNRNYSSDVLPSLQSCSLEALCPSRDENAWRGGCIDALGCIDHIHCRRYLSTISLYLGLSLIQGSLNEFGEQVHFPQEYVFLFGVFDEKESWFTPAGYSSSNHVMHTINGYAAGSLPGQSSSFLSSKTSHR